MDKDVKIHYACKGKGGVYRLVGLSIGAGTSRDEKVVVYQDTETGRMYHRTILDFDDRMEPIKAENHA